MPPRATFKPRHYPAGKRRYLHDDDPLDAREARFVAEYLVDLNASQAAIRAGYSPKGSRQTAHELMRRDRVLEALEEAQAARLARAGVTADRVLKDIDAAANLDIGDLFDAAGNLRPIHLLPAHVRRCVVSIKVRKMNLQAGDGFVDTVHEIKLIDKGKMHEILAKHTGLTIGDAAGDGAPAVPAFALPAETPGVSVH